MTSRYFYLVSRYHNCAVCHETKTNTEEPTFLSMDDFSKTKLSSSVLSFIILLLMHGRNIFGIPQGCWYNGGEAGCNFQRWAPPLLDKDFETGIVHGLTLNSINGSISAGVGL